MKGDWKEWWDSAGEFRRWEWAADAAELLDERDTTIAHLTAERDEALAGYERQLNLVRFYKSKFEDPEEMEKAATELATTNAHLTAVIEEAQAALVETLNIEQNVVHALTILAKADPSYSAKATEESCGHCVACGTDKIPGATGPIGDLCRIMVVCIDCGNKRCPKATDHRNACTGSNVPGQYGSAYSAPNTQEKTDEEKYAEAMDDFAAHTTPGGTWIMEDEG